LVKFDLDGSFNYGSSFFKFFFVPEVKDPLYSIGNACGRTDVLITFCLSCWFYFRRIYWTQV